MKQRGVTLLETILVLSLIAIIMIGGLNLYKNASSSSKANKAVQEITAVASGVRNIYSSRASYTGMLILDGSPHMKAFIASGGVPSDMVTGNDSMKNVFGGAVRVVSNSVDKSSFRIIYLNVPKEACYKMVTKDFGGTFVSQDLGWGGGCDGESSPTPGNPSASNCVSIPATFAGAKSICDDLDPSNGVLHFFFD